MSKVHTISTSKGNQEENVGTFKMISFLAKTLDSSASITSDSIKNSGFKKDASPRMFNAVTLKDKSEWVIGDKGIERIIGAKYLDLQLKTLTGLNFKWSAVPTKYYQNSKIEFSSASELVKPSRSPILSLSQYVGSAKPKDSPELRSDKLEITEATGFSDFPCNANLRKQLDGSIIIIDTERTSFTGRDEVFSFN